MSIVSYSGRLRRRFVALFLGIDWEWTPLSHTYAPIFPVCFALLRSWPLLTSMYVCLFIVLNLIDDYLIVSFRILCAVRMILSTSVLSYTVALPIVGLAVTNGHWPSRCCLSIMVSNLPLTHALRILVTLSVLDVDCAKAADTITIETVWLAFVSQCPYLARGLSAYTLMRVSPTDYIDGCAFLSTSLLTYRRDCELSGIRLALRSPADCNKARQKQGEEGRGRISLRMPTYNKRRTLFRGSVLEQYQQDIFAWVSVPLEWTGSDPCRCAVLIASVIDWRCPS